MDTFHAVMQSSAILQYYVSAACTVAAQLTIPQTSGRRAYPVGLRICAASQGEVSFLAMSPDVAGLWAT